MGTGSDADRREETITKKRITGRVTPAQDSTPLTFAEFAALISVRGFPLPELDDWNVGMIVDWVCEHDKIQKRMRGETVEEPYEQYLTLKAMEPEIDEMYAAGQIRKEKYESYKESLRICEMQLEE